ncbi:MAG: hypothetical protein E6R03_06160 [Hyphomicrobiaceae bacterium]|nr:MAG: hypothetical protein E6R03_06160 [Hyphomicrobiaceae bacterium]
MPKNISYLCPHCGEDEVKEVSAANDSLHVESQALYRCNSCPWFGNETQLFTEPMREARAEHNGIPVDAGVAYALRQDESRGEPGGGSSSGSSSKDRPKGQARPEQGSSPVFGDDLGRQAQAFCRDLVYGAKFTQQEAVGLEAAIANSGLGKSKWIQRALVATARQEMGQQSA